MVRVFQVLMPVSVLALMFADLIVIGLSFTAAAWLDPSTETTFLILYDTSLVSVSLVALTILAATYLIDLYSDLRVRSNIFLFQQMFFVMGVTLIVEALITYVNPNLMVPRNIMLIGSALCLAGLFACHLLFHIAIQHAVGVQKLLFLGGTSQMFELARYLRAHPEIGLWPCGYLDDAHAHDGSEELPRLGPVDDFMRVVDTAQPEWIALGRQLRPWWADDFLELNFGGVHIEDTHALYESFLGRLCASEALPAELLFTEHWTPRQTTERVQSLYSFLLALMATIVTLPLMLLIAVMLRVTSSGPVFLRHLCMGQYNRPFTRLRFQCSPESFLRRSGLYALPQLLNVLAGTMSVIGPHPERVEFAEALARSIPFYAHRHLVKPGLFGWAGIHRDDYRPQDVIRALEYDLYYVKNVALALDFVVMVRTLKGLVRLQRAPEARASARNSG